MYKIFNTNNSLAATFARLFLGVVLFPHGAQKLLGWFGGYGFSGTMNFFTETMNLPWIVAFLVIVIEFFGAVFLIAGIATRVVSFSILFLFLGIAFTHTENGFFMNWFGNQQGEGIEYFLLVLGLALSLVVSGAGKLSLDQAIAAKFNSQRYSKEL
jgi:putative oxidoreductase